MSRPALTLVGVGAYDLFFEGFVVFVVVGLYAECLAGLILERCSSHELANTYMHVEEKIHFGDFWYIALYENCSFIRINTCCKIFGYDSFYVGVEFVGSGISGESMQIGDKEITVIVALKGNEFLKGAEIVAQMEISGRTYAAQYYFFLFVHDMQCGFEPQNY